MVSNKPSEFLSPSPTPSPPTDKKLSTPTIIVFSILGVFLICVLFFSFYCRAKKKPSINKVIRGTASPATPAAAKEEGEEEEEKKEEFPLVAATAAPSMLNSNQTDEEEQHSTTNISNSNDYDGDNEDGDNEDDDNGNTSPMTRSGYTTLEPFPLSNTNTDNSDIPLTSDANTLDDSGVSYATSSFLNEHGMYDLSSRVNIFPSAASDFDQSSTGYGEGETRSDYSSGIEVDLLVDDDNISTDSSV